MSVTIPEVELLGRKIVVVTSGNLELDSASARTLAEILASSARLLDKAQREADVEEARSRAEATPVDRSCQVLVSGAPVPKDRSHVELKPNGQQRDYVVLCDAERAKGFVRPVRRSYRHLKCGTVTTMSQYIAETYARDPCFYSGTFCCGCGTHLPVGADGEFVWVDDGTKVGT